MEKYHKLGKDLTQSELDVINEWRLKEFHSDHVWTLSDISRIADRTFFFVVDNNQIAAFCCLRPISVYIKTDEYPVYGLAAVVSTIRGKGYGKELMLDVMNFVRQEDKDMIGFCEAKNNEFYRKCGLIVLEEGIERFSYIDEHDEPHTEHEGTVLWQPGKSDLYKRFSEDPSVIILHYLPPW